MTYLFFLCTVEAKVVLKFTQRLRSQAVKVSRVRIGPLRSPLNCDGCSGRTIWPIISVSPNVPFKEAPLTFGLMPCGLYCLLKLHGCIRRSSPLTCRLILLDTVMMMYEGRKTSKIGPRLSESRTYFGPQTGLWRVRQQSKMSSLS